MSSTKLRTKIKDAVDRVSPDHLKSLADYVGFLTNPSFEERIARARKDAADGRTVSWRKVQKNV